MLTHNHSKGTDQPCSPQRRSSGVYHRFDFITPTPSSSLIFNTLHMHIFPPAHLRTCTSSTHIHFTHPHNHYTCTCTSHMHIINTHTHHTYTTHLHTYTSHMHKIITHAHPHIVPPFLHSFPWFHFNFFFSENCNGEAFTTQCIV